MSVEKELLWKAFPDGYLAIPQVRSVDDWIYFGDGVWVEYGSISFPTMTVLPFKWKASENVQMGEEDTRANWEDGRFLPNVDPMDHATWACLLAHLNELMGYEDEGYSHSWWRNGNMVAFKEGAWILDCGPGLCGEFDIDCADPAEALVRAIIQVREEGWNE